MRGRFVLCCDNTLRHGNAGHLCIVMNAAIILNLPLVVFHTGSGSEGLKPVPLPVLPEASCRFISSSAFSLDVKSTPESIGTLPPWMCI